ncbi:MAG: universal stress protein [Candidatus Nanosalina sp.]
MYDRILVPTDGSDASVGPSLEHALRIAQNFDSVIHVLYVSDTKLENNPLFMGDSSPVGKDATKQVEEKAHKYGVQCKTSVTEGDPAEEIMDYSKGHAIDLIVMGTHGRTGLSRILKGSVTEEVMRKSRKAVLAVDREE